MMLDCTKLDEAPTAELTKALASLPAGDYLRVSIRHELALRTLRNVERQRIAKRRAAQLRSRVKSSSIMKAAAIDMSATSNDDLAAMAVTEDDNEKRSAALIEIGRRTLTGQWTKSSALAVPKAKPKAAPAPPVTPPSGAHVKETADLPADLQKARRNALLDGAADVLHDELKRRTAGR